MRSWVKVVSPEQYKRFVSDKRRQIQAAQTIVQKTVQKNAAPGAAQP
jgi:hypothetical protein